MKAKSNLTIRGRDPVEWGSREEKSTTDVYFMAYSSSPIVSYS